MREHIIKETTRLFLQYGLKAIRMDDIATQLGVSKRTIYEIFGDKETLIYECMEYYNNKLHAEKNRIMSQASNIIEEFILLLKNWEKDADANYNLIVSLKRFYPNIYKKLSEGHAQKEFETLKRKMIEGVEKGYLLKSVNYDLAISVFTYSIYGIISNQKAILPNNVSEKEAFKYVVTYFFRGIATEKGRKLIDEYLENKII